MAVIKGCSVVDMFCGAGGLTHGFVLEGFRVIAGIDVDASCKFAYEHNNQAEFIHSSIKDVKLREFRKLYPRNHTKILVGCAPCQSFSQYNKKKGRADENDKWKLLYDFADLIERAHPHIVSMENVPELVNFKGGKIFGDFVSRLRISGYEVSHYIVYCPDYGIPQKRTRLVLFASKFGSIRLQRRTHRPNRYRTVDTAIRHLPFLQAGEVDPKDPLHRAANLSELNLRRIQQSVQGGTWRDWDEDLVAECHKKDTGKSYDSVYGRMKWDEPSPTITTECNGYGNGRFGHPTQDRAISMREAAILQTFPKNYQFLSPTQKWHMEKLARMIGNAVPVQLGRVIARSIKHHLGK